MLKPDDWVERLHQKPPVELARRIVNTSRKDDVIIWDTETTGLSNARIVTIGAINVAGDVVLDLVLNPGIPIPPDASAVHGVTDDEVEHCPAFPDVYEQIRDALAGKVWVIYNAAYDTQVLIDECLRHGLRQILPFSQKTAMAQFCAMKAYAEYYGDWNDYHQSYRWQKLSQAAAQCGIDATGAHNALADAIMTLEVLRHMAKTD